MTELKFYLLCFMIAAPQGALGSAAQSYTEAPISRGGYVTYSISIPPDSEFVEKRLRKNDLFIGEKTQQYVQKNAHEECLPEAISRGAHGFIIEEDFCLLLTLYHPMCSKYEGDMSVYIRKDMLSDGSPSDNVTHGVDLLDEYAPDDVLRYYRIESPTILEFGNFHDGYPSAKEVFQYFAMLHDRKLVHYDSPVMADPSCYTTSSCSELFVTIAPEIPASDLFILHDICGKTIQVDSGRSIYVLSHEGIGCKNFPNDYPVADCSAEFTGAGEITMNMTFVNFREIDHCDGFTMRAVTTSGVDGYGIPLDLCVATAPTELTSVSGKIRIEFGRSIGLRPRREKYGFNFQVTAA